MQPQCEQDEPGDNVPALEKGRCQHEKLHNPPGMKRPAIIPVFMGSCKTGFRPYIPLHIRNLRHDSLKDVPRKGELK
jgi:hypothetical protein